MSNRVETDKKGIQFHYDLPPEFFHYFLDPGMNYSCCYFQNKNDPLEKAAKNKLALICKKLNISKDDYVLDIGCGWGNFVLFAAENFGCHVTGITLSPSQANYIKNKALEKRLSYLINTTVMHAYKMDFGPQKFDKIVTIGAIEHIADLRKMFAKCFDVLKDNGLMLVHGMSIPWRNRKEQLEGKFSESMQFLREHIFPVGQMITLNEVLKAMEENNFEIIDVENITDHYTLTLRCWLNNLQKNKKEIEEKKIVEPLKLRAQLLFLMGCVEAFKDGNVYCYHTLARKIPKENREQLPLTREGYCLYSEPDRKI